MALTVGGVPFEDVRVSFADWGKLKPETPYGSLPFVSIDGEVAAQANAILRYIGKITNLYPEDARAGLKVDEALDVAHDLLNNAFRYGGSDKEGLKKDRADYVENVLPKLMAGLEKRLKAMGDGPWIADEMSIADLTLANYVRNIKTGWFEFVPKDSVDQYTRVVGVYEAVVTHPKIVEMYKSK